MQMPVWYLQELLYCTSRISILEDHIAKVIDQWDHYDHAVGSVKHPAVSRYNITPILSARYAFDERADEVAPGGSQTDNKRQRDPVEQGKTGGKGKTKEADS